jgi:hypothetical protein
LSAIENKSKEQQRLLSSKTEELRRCKSTLANFKNQFEVVFINGSMKLENIKWKKKS